MSRLLRLCYITDRHALEPKPLLPKIQQGIRAGIDLVQIREKDLPTRDLAQLVSAALDNLRATAVKRLETEDEDAETNFSVLASILDGSGNATQRDCLLRGTIEIEESPLPA